jgi:hypothetical protein
MTHYPTRTDFNSAASVEKATRNAMDAWQLIHLTLRCLHSRSELIDDEVTSPPYLLPSSPDEEIVELSKEALYCAWVLHSCGHVGMLN